MKTNARKIVFTVLSLLIVAALAFALMKAGAYLPYKEEPFDRDEYRAQLSSIYKEYNTEKAYTDFENGDSFAFKRLLVNGYNGKKYGASHIAYDRENGFAVLQYDTRKDAQKAYYKIQSDGLIAETEGTAELCASDAGEVYPEGSGAIGTPQYISKIGMTKQNIKVAIVDTGIMYDHVELVGRINGNGYDYSEDALDNAYYDTSKEGTTYGHATFVAGIIANNTPTSVKLVPYKVVPFGKSVATASAMISAINDAVSGGASVVNVSLSSASSGNSFRAAVKNAKEHGVCVVAAAGNYSKVLDSLYPASIDETIAVSALENDFSTLADFSNYGELIDFCATGRKVRSLAVYQSDSDRRYKTGSGTSFSAPYISAVCADIKTVNKDISVDDLCGVLSDFAVDLGDEGKDAYFGWGMPNLSDICYTDNESYTFRIPEGTLDVYDERNYTADTQPWRAFADKLTSVNVDDDIDRIGDYNFYNVKSATFTMRSSYSKIGTYAFYGCENVKDITFTMFCREIGAGAFGGIDGMVINGYRNTAAEAYAQSEDIPFNAIGCNHNYIVEYFDPTPTDVGYTKYTCTVCQNSYNAPYVAPALLSEGKCGDNLNYHYYERGKLVIDGSGEMYAYTDSEAPWSGYAYEINRIEIGADVTYVSPFAFYGCNSINRITCSQDNTVYRTQNNALYSADMTELILLPKINTGTYNMPDSVTLLSAPAMMINGAQSIVFNSSFTLDNGIIRDNDGNIICALPSFSDIELTIDSDISVSDYAFILAPTLQTLYVDTLEASFGDYSVGYCFNGEMTKLPLVIETYDKSTAKAYADENGFTCRAYNKGVCGETAEWYYDVDSATLTISGQGDLYDCVFADEVPWSEYNESLLSVVIGDEITSLTSYAFYGADKLEAVTLPLSLEAPENSTVWYNCNSIKAINMTLGSGRTDDYSKNGIELYRFTPWYLSRNSITSFTVDENALYIGADMFRDCTALEGITLNKCEQISAGAFVNCTKLNSITLAEKSCVIADYSLLFCTSDGVNYSVNNNGVLRGYDDSTAKDYCAEFSVRFESIGCGHSRSIQFVSSEIFECCFDNVYHYHCLDCDNDFNEYIPTTDGHYVTGKLITREGLPISDADVYIDGVFYAVTNSRGAFVAEGVKCGNHTAEFRNDGHTFCTADISVDKNNVSDDFTVAYGDYNLDGFVNGRDLAFVKTNSIDDKHSFDWGENAGKYVFDTPSDAPENPYSKDHRFIPDTVTDYRQCFSLMVVNDSEYSVITSGFLYGSRMDADDLVLEKANTYNENGNLIRIAETTDFKAETKTLVYGLKSKQGWFGVRYYINYSNGKEIHTYYSDVYKFSYN
ncbi:MAG: leucine-rich repeat protein [Eubacterium sp.]|nr:leucine-rich repeat protein [Eubacterium sp.]